MSLGPTNGNGNGKLIWWGMGIFACLVTAAVIGWVGRAEAQFEKAMETEKAVDLIRYRLDVMDQTMKEQRDDTRAIRRMFERDRENGERRR